MSLDNKPNIDEPFAITERDDFGNTVMRITLPWFNYFDSVDKSINTTVVQNITNQSISSSGAFSATFQMVDDLVSEVSNLKAELARLNSKPVEVTRSELENINSQLAIIRNQEPINLSNIEAMLAQLLAKQTEEFRDDTTWLSKLVNVQA